MNQTIGATNGCGGSLMGCVASKETEQIVRRLEQGSVLTKFYNKGKPERKTFFVRLETRQLVWTVSGKTAIEGSLDLREVKEVRIGPISKIFDKWHEEECVRKWDRGQCLSLLYGNSFRLKTLSCVGMTFTPTLIFFWFLFFIFYLFSFVL
jgi:phosphatidylinositol phospholipase C gamma-1